MEGREQVLHDLLSHSHLSKALGPFLYSVLKAGLAFQFCLVVATFGTTLAPSKSNKLQAPRCPHGSSATSGRAQE